MVLESIMDPKNAGDKPFHIFIIAILYSLISMFFSLKFFPEQASILTIAIITILFVPFFQKIYEKVDREFLLRLPDHAHPTFRPLPKPPGNGS